LVVWCLNPACVESKETYPDRTALAVHTATAHRVNKQAGRKSTKMSGGAKGVPDRTAVLKVVEASGKVNSRSLAEQFGCEHQDMVGVFASIASLEGICKASTSKVIKLECTEEGASFAKDGSVEARVFNAIPAEGVSMKDFNSLPEIKALGKAAGFGKGTAMKLKWLSMEKGTLVKTVEAIEDVTQAKLAYVIGHGDEMEEEALKAGGVAGAAFVYADCKDLMKRKLVKKVTYTDHLLEPGPSFTTEPVIATSDLTSDMLKKDGWKTMTFKKFNLDAAPVAPRGALHPLLKVRTEFRKIFLEMGFEEMPTNNYVESSFWNFDALFQPQQHPARDAHDTFFMKSPESTREIPEAYLQKVKKQHEEGGYGSIGYRYDWSRDEARKNILRTHTTAVSTRMLYQLGLQQPFKPVKYFSIDRVFRNETLDATHLAEFHQVEGLVCDYNLTLGNLIGMINSFFTKLGMKDIKFKPAYNPYTEPSMEIFAYSEELGKEVEVGNSGIFRPEMLRPMGLPEDVTVIAWGLSVERPTMIKYGYDNIRDLFGASVNLDLVKQNEICRI